MSWLFKLRGAIPKGYRLPLEVIGVGLLILIWWIVTRGENPMIPSFTLPTPLNVVKSFGSMIEDNNLVKNTFLSIGLNLAGYVKALFYTVIIGFIIGLYPLFRGMYQRPIDAVRFIPLAATMSLFIVWFGTGVDMKVNFLAFGIFIFLTPIVVQRIHEVNEVYLKTVYTIGATDWHTIKSVYIPSVFSRLIDDIRVLTAISWTYIIFIENIAKEGGLGAILFTAKRLVQTDKLFGVLVLIIIIGIIQDRIFVNLDKELFPHKFQQKNAHSKAPLKPSVWDTILSYTFASFIWSLLGLYVFIALNEFFGFIGDIKVLDYLFGDTCWAIHLIMLSIIAYKGWKFYNYNRNKFVKPKTQAA